VAAKTTRTVTGKIRAFLWNWDTAATAKAVTDALKAEIAAFLQFGVLRDCCDGGEKAESTAVTVEIRAFLQLIRVRQLAWGGC